MAPPTSPPKPPAWHSNAFFVANRHQLEDLERNLISALMTVWKALGKEKKIVDYTLKK